VITRTFLKPTDSILFELRDKSSPLNFTQYSVLLHNMQITDYCDVTSPYVHRVSKNVPPLTCYNLDTHDPITIIFGRSVTKKVRNQMMLCLPTSSI